MCILFSLNFSGPPSDVRDECYYSISCSSTAYGDSGSCWYVILLLNTNMFVDICSDKVEKCRSDCFCSAPRSGSQGYKKNFVLNSAEHEILNAHQYKNIKKFRIFRTQISLECYFFFLKC